MTTSSVMFMSTPLGMLLLISGVVCTFLAILELTGMWCLLQKMGRHDFAALVPGYNLWEFARGAGLRSGACVVFMLVLIAFAVCATVHSQSFYESMFSNPVVQMNFLFSVTTGSTNALAIFLNAWMAQLMLELRMLDPWLIATGVLFIIYLIFFIVVMYGVSRSFGHGFFFMLGMIILPFIFIPLLGFSKKQHYRGPHFDKELRAVGQDKWETAVQARIRAFGSNAPLALALIGLTLSMLFMPILALIFYIIAFVKNRANKGKPLSGAKYGMTIAVIIVGLIICALSTFLMISIGDSISGLSGMF